MNNHEAKFILGAYRPSGRDAGDPEMAAALRQAREDPALGIWFKGETGFDAAFAQQVKSIPVPDTLRATILAGLKMTDAVRTPARSFGYGKWLAMAATFIVFAGMGGLWLQHVRVTRLRGWQTGAIGEISSILEGKTTFDHASPDAVKLLAWLNVKNAPTLRTLPAGLQTLASLGCKTIQWKGRPVSIICFNLGNDSAVHLVIIDRAGLPNAPPENQPQFVKDGDWITASWSEGGKAMMLTTKGDRKNIEKFFL